jgi:chromate reductase
MIKILGIAGSLRNGSYNKAALRAAKNLVPENATLNIFEHLGEIPLFNQDLENNPPGAVIELKKAIKEADAILFVTPEYNYSIPGVLKNAIDWASRPYGDNSWEDKPVAITGASPGMLGTARAQNHLRQILLFSNMHPVNRPEVMIGSARENFDEHLNLTDEYTKEKIKELLAALVSWTLRLHNNS